MNLSLVWLRRDLRLNDHAALAAALAQPGQVQPVFVFDAEILVRFTNPQDRRLVFLAETLCQLDRDLRQRGGGLLVLHGKATEIIPHLATIGQVGRVVCAEDFEPKTRDRDRAVSAALPAHTAWVRVLDHLLRAPCQGLKEDGTPFKVFTPFAKRWRAQLAPMEYAECVVQDAGRYADTKALAASAQAVGLRVMRCDLGPEAMLDAMGYRYVPDPLWQPADAQVQLERFCMQKLHAYQDQRDLLAAEGTSRLSPYLRFGLVSVRACMRRAAEKPGEGAKVWVNELIWRDFYASILYHFPEVETQEFQAQYRGLPWSQNEAYFQAWAEGKTGYPVVDAAMRELRETGWMHNRARMIVASFLTKHLQIDWRRGEEHFAQYLMDYDLASNNGGWQWAASVGTDAQPYFRVFNPSLQSARFDAEGQYIRRYVPELNGLNNKEIHMPLGMLRPRGYPAPLVEHATARAAVIALFKRVKAKAA